MTECQVGQHGCVLDYGWMSLKVPEINFNTELFNVTSPSHSISVLYDHSNNLKCNQNQKACPKAIDRSKIRTILIFLFSVSFLKSIHHWEDSVLTPTTVDMAFMVGRVALVGFPDKLLRFIPVISPLTDKYLNSVVFWNVTQCRLVSHRRFGTTYRSHLR